MPRLSELLISTGLPKFAGDSAEIKRLRSTKFDYEIDAQCEVDIHPNFQARNSIRVTVTTKEGDKISRKWVKVNTSWPAPQTYKWQSSCPEVVPVLFEKLYEMGVKTAYMGEIYEFPEESGTGPVMNYALYRIFKAWGAKLPAWSDLLKSRYEALTVEREQIASAMSAIYKLSSLSAAVQESMRSLSQSFLKIDAEIKALTVKINSLANAASTTSAMVGEGSAETGAAPAASSSSSSSSSSSKTSCKRAQPDPDSAQPSQQQPSARRKGVKPSTADEAAAASSSSSTSSSKTSRKREKTDTPSKLAQPAGQRARLVGIKPQPAAKTAKAEQATAATTGDATSAEAGEAPTAKRSNSMG